MIGNIQRPEVRVGHSEIARPAPFIPQISLPGDLLSAGVRTGVVLNHERGKVRIELEGSAPAWFLPTIDSFAQLLALPEDWNSYGARRVDPESIASAISLLFSIMRDDSPPPVVIPTRRGGVQLEWHLRGIDLEVELLARGPILVCSEDLIEHTEWEAELTADLDPIRKVLQELSSRRSR